MPTRRVVRSRSALPIASERAALGALTPSGVGAPMLYLAAFSPSYSGRVPRPCDAPALESHATGSCCAPAELRILGCASMRVNAHGRANAPKCRRTVEVLKWPYKVGGTLREFTMLTNRIRELRALHGRVSAGGLGQYVGITRQTLAAIEAGKCAPSLDWPFALLTHSTCPWTRSSSGSMSPTEVVCWRRHRSKPRRRRAGALVRHPIRQQA